ncbi:FIG074102: hypothetical protein [hydrothermal vent metagenome]|uniref:Cytoplasmic protein clustered with trehalase n=1 Tax=hydrothermal vent metagenome TaxID=652676 RepID=A0A3B0SIG9_9ZZZZ
MTSVHPFRINNRDARRLWLNAQGLARAPTGTPDVLALIKQLGFVQLDTLQNVVRAHHHILWSRNQNYREQMLDKLLGQDRTIFEHFTHDASVIPMDYYPVWQRQFGRMRQKLEQREYYRSTLASDDLYAVKARIEAEGPLSSHAFDTKIIGKKEMWARPPHKRALDHLWYVGDLATSHRENFTKYYDLTERVIPSALREAGHDDAYKMDWLCKGALERLAFASQGEIQRFWGAMDAKETKQWIKENTDILVPVEVETANGEWITVYALENIEDRFESCMKPNSRLRILNPFDPVVRDRDRLTRLFGFDYRIEIFVPAAQRKWGYYVYPLLEGDRFVGRIEVKADRKIGKLIVLNLWKEPGIKWTDARLRKLDAELTRLAQLVAAKEIVWDGARG